MFLNAPETFSVNGTATEFPDGCPVVAGGISLVFAKSELRVFLMVNIHQIIPGYLGNNGCRRYGYAETIAAHNRVLRQAGRYPEGAVYQQKIRLGKKTFNRHGHGLQGGLQDIDPIDLGRINNTDTDGNRMRVYLNVQLPTLFVG